MILTDFRPNVLSARSQQNDNRWVAFAYRYLHAYINSKNLECNVIRNRKRLQAYVKVLELYPSFQTKHTALAIFSHVFSVGTERIKISLWNVVFPRCTKTPLIL